MFTHCLHLCIMFSTTMQIVWILFQVCRTQPFKVFYMVSSCVDGIWLQGVAQSGFLIHNEMMYCEAGSHSVFCVCHLPLPCDRSADKQT